MKTWLAGLLIALATLIMPAPPPKPKPLLQYTYANLQKRNYPPMSVSYDGNKFYFYSDGKKVSGTVTGDYKNDPIIILIRGYADKESYYPGFGTERTAALLSKNGFATLAPDFLGYGESASPSADPFEDRFLTYTTVLDLIASVKPAGIWSHSNGGQIALSVLEISGKNIPTVLWNPVSVTFPYSILYYTWDNDDQGKALRKALAAFETDYNTADYDPANFLAWINGPILLQQGLADDQVPPKWSDNLAASLSARKKDITYKTYPGNDHNMMPNWDKAAKDMLNFYLTHI